MADILWATIKSNLPDSPSGKLYLIKGEPSPYAVQKIPWLTDKQLIYRGFAAAFKFRAFGCRWRYEPDVRVLNVG
jgi:hypothetical protein